MGSNNVKTAPDSQTDVSPTPQSPLYKPHQSPTRDAFFTPMASPALTDTGSTHKEQTNNDGLMEGWGAPFSQAMEEIQRASTALDQMHSQLRGLLTAGHAPEGSQILDSAHGWESRLIEVRKDLKGGLKDLSDLKSWYQAHSAGNGPITARETSQETRESQEEFRLKERVRHLEAENQNLTSRLSVLQGEVEDLTLLQSDLRTAVAVAERFRAEAQEKLERIERENQRLRAQGSDTVDWPEGSAVNGGGPGYRSLPRGVILSSRKVPIVKSNSLMSVPPGGSSSLESDAAASSRRERRGSLETLLNQPKATANLTEDSGSFFRRYGGSKRGVFLRWAQDRTCGYKHVVITNFSSSWVDGMALCALLHSYLPDRIPFSQLRPLEKRKNLQLAFQVAESVGIPSILNPDHMLQLQGPDWQRVLLYVESIYQKFEA